MSINDLFSNVATRLAKVENQFVGYNSDSAGPAGEGMLELIEQLKLAPEIGYPLQGEIFNTVVRGARLTKFLSYVSCDKRRKSIAKFDPLANSRR